MGPSSSWKRTTKAVRRAIQHRQESLRTLSRRHGVDPKTIAKWNTLPELTRSSLHRCLQRHRISRLPDVDRDRPRRKKFKQSPIGRFHIDRAEATVKRFYSKTHQHFTEPLLQTWIG